MSSQTSNSNIQTPQQSRAAASKPFSSLPYNHSNRSWAPTSSSGAPKKMVPKFFEEYGLCVALVRLGQKRLHARSASELATKTTSSLLAVVKDIAFNKVSKLKSASKSDIALWIERAETLALGPHPETTLPSTKKEDLIAALGLKITAPKAKCDKAKKDATRRRPAPKKVSSPIEEKVIAPSIVPRATNTDKAKQKTVLDQEATPPTSSPEQQPTSKVVATSKQILHQGIQESAEGAHKSNKRKYASADAPTAAEQTPAKKPRAISPPAPRPTSSPLMSATVVTEAEVAGLAPSAPHIRQAPLVAAHTPPAATPSPRPQPLRSSTPELDGAAEHPQHPERLQEPPFRLPGPHGLHTSFSPSSLLSGRGHQVPPAELERRRAYDARYRAFYARNPFFPFLDPERRAAAGVVEGLVELRREEGWMRGYRERWPGEVVGHLWDCGCVRITGEDDGGEESEEE